MSAALRKASPRVTRAAMSAAERCWPAGGCTDGDGACGVAEAGGAAAVGTDALGCGICSGRTGAGVGTAGAACGFGGSGVGGRAAADGAAWGAGCGGATLGEGSPAGGSDRSSGVFTSGILT